MVLLELDTRLIRRTELIKKLFIMCLIISVLIVPASVYAYQTLPPDDTNKLSDIFPDAVLAKDIADIIGQTGNFDYVPSDESEFDNVTAVSLPNSDVTNIYGLEYCNKLTNLYIPGNKCEERVMEVLADLNELKVLNLARNNFSSGVLSYLKDLSITELDLSENDFTSDNTDILPQTLVELDMSNNMIDDTGAKAIADLPSLKILDLSQNSISDKGAVALSGISNASELSVNLDGNNISPHGVQQLLDAGFKSLSINEQLLTAPTIVDGYTEIIHDTLVDSSYIDEHSITSEGVLNISKSSIIWPARKDNVQFTYTYIFSGHTGSVVVPFVYEPFIYTITFDDKTGNINTVYIKEDDLIPEPNDPKREEYIFLGWFSDRGGNDLYDFDLPVSQDITLYATWDKNVEDTDIKEENQSDLNNDMGKSAGTNDQSNFKIYFIIVALISIILTMLLRYRMKE